MNPRSRILLPCAVLCLAAIIAQAEVVRLEWLTSGAVNQRLGFYIPASIALSATRPATIKVVPPDLKAPLYGVVKVGPTDWPNTFAVIVDEPEDGPLRIFFDANGNGDLTDDAPLELKPIVIKGAIATYLTGADPLVNYGKEPVGLHICLYRFVRGSPRYEQFKTVMFYYPDYARIGNITLDGKTYPVTLIDEIGSGDFRNMDSDGGERLSATSMATPTIQLFVDTAGVGKVQRQVDQKLVVQPLFPANLPFQVDGKAYEIRHLTASGDSFEVIPSPAELITSAQIDRLRQMAKGADGHDYTLPPGVAAFFGLKPDASFRSITFSDDFQNTSVQMILLPDGYLLVRSLYQKAYPCRLLRVDAHFGLQTAANWNQKNPPIAIEYERAAKVHHMDVTLWRRIVEEIGDSK